MPVELRTLRKFEDITYEPSREEAAPTPPPRQDRTAILKHACLSACLPVCLLACLPTPQGRGGARFECICRGDTGTELQEVQRYRYVEGGKP